MKQNPATPVASVEGMGSVTELELAERIRSEDKTLCSLPLAMFHLLEIEAADSSTDLGGRARVLCRRRGRSDARPSPATMSR
jgi:hypothetical protein